MLARSPGVVPHLSGGGCPPGLRRGLRRGRDQDQDEDQDQVPRAPASDPSQLTSGGNGGPGWQRRISSRVPRWVFFSRTGNFARTNFFLLFFVNVPRVGAVLLVCPRAPRGVVGVWRWSCGRDSSARSRSAGHGRGINCRPAQSPPLNTTRRPKAKAMTPCAVVVVVGGDAWARLGSARLARAETDTCRWHLVSPRLDAASVEVTGELETRSRGSFSSVSRRLSTCFLWYLHVLLWVIFF